MQGSLREALSAGGFAQARGAGGPGSGCPSLSEARGAPCRILSPRPCGGPSRALNSVLRSPQKVTNSPKHRILLTASCQPESHPPLSASLPRKIHHALLPNDRGSQYRHGLENHGSGTLTASATSQGHHSPPGRIQGPNPPFKGFPQTNTLNPPGRGQPADLKDHSVIIGPCGCRSHRVAAATDGNQKGCL